MTKYSNHYLKCSAPICLSEKSEGWKKTLVWYPGELVCKRRPYTKVQKNQKEINGLLRNKRIRNIEGYFTAEVLEKIKIISEKTRGK